MKIKEKFDRIIILKDQGAIKPLKKLLKNNDKVIRENAKQTLENIQKPTD
ncbi:MAG: armadillo/beta-catenin-like repeat-containing protein [Elusimicrobiota bacterium]|nr:armadillo/beta-catenin-like repeat-containing protein [Elusimicrobiota bacterium]